MSSPLVGPGVRIAVEEFVPRLSQRMIHSAWESAGFPRFNGDLPDQGVRRALFRSYCEQVNWNDRGEAERAMRAFRDLIDAGLEALFGDTIYPGDVPEGERLQNHLVRALRDAGLSIDENNLIILPTATGLADEAWDSIEDPEVISEHLDRLYRAIGQKDVALVIGSAKELMESTAKITLRSAGESVPQKPEFQPLVKRVHTLLELNQHDIVPDADHNDPKVKSRKAINQVLQGAWKVAVGMDEYRNAVGTGHGRERQAPGMKSRHARLAVDAATLWCNLVLATVSDDDAPWKSQKRN